MHEDNISFFQNLLLKEEDQFFDRTEADDSFFYLLGHIDQAGKLVSTRNSLCKRIRFFSCEFTSFPLVTVVPVAVKKALIEMEWFLSKKLLPRPDEIADWWEGQLSEDGYYLCGYGDQLRRFYGVAGLFDQIDEAIEQLRGHPYSRRNLITTWNPPEMANITEINDNPKTPANCHLTMVQFFVDPDGSLHVNSYQRSGDCLAGVKHNWVQHWALFAWMAHRAGLKIGSMTWIGGDLHIYQEESHIRVANAVIDGYPNRVNTVRPQLIYTPTSEDFKASDFAVEWPCEKPETLTKERVKLI